jgi:MoxR-like ATPase
MDRFMMKVVISYPNKEEEKEILRSQISPNKKTISPVIKPETIIHARDVVKEVYVDTKIENYITDIVFATRFPEEYGLNNIKPMIAYGASPRATINLALASRALAFIKRRGYVIPEDVREVCLDVMRHRVGLTYEAEAENIKSEDIVTEIVNKIEVP